MMTDRLRCPDVEMVLQEDSDSAVTLPSRFEKIFIKSGGKPFAFDNGDLRSLHFDERYIQSVMYISAPDQLVLSYTRAMMGFLLFHPQPKRILMIGLGGGSLAKFCYKHLPGSQVTALELDADVIALRSTFCVPEDDDRFQVIHTDAVEYLTCGCDPIFDVILHDGFTADGLAPELCTRSFYGACERALTSNGVLVSNIWGDAEDLLPLTRQMNFLFQGKTCYGTAEGSYNHIIFAFKSRQPKRSRYELSQQAREIENRFGISLQPFLETLQDPRLQRSFR